MLHLTLGSYNVGGVHPDPGRRPWRVRQPRVLEAVDATRPALMAFQEIPAHGRQALAASMSVRGYALASTAVNAASLPEAMYYRRDALELRGSGREALIAALVDGAQPMARPRFVQWADLRTRDGHAIRACNFHLIGSGFKRAATDYVLDREGFRNAFLLGDFNTVPTEHVHRRLMDEGWVDPADSRLHRDPGPTIHRYGNAARRRIDWILAPRGWETLGYRVPRRVAVLDEPSDHHPVFAHVGRDVAPVDVAAGLGTLLGRVLGIHRGADTLK